MSRNAYLLISAAIFGLIGIGHVLRLVWQIPVQIGDMQAPMWPSAGAVVLTVVLCAWAFRLWKPN